MAVLHGTLVDAFATLAGSGRTLDGDA